VTTSNQISLRQLRYFVTVAEELHFRRAAEKLNMSQPPLTQRIRDLERDLGVELFRRVGHTVNLTDAGRVVLEAAKETLAQAESLREVAHRAARGEYGHIRLGLTTTALFFDPIQQGMRSFQQHYPDVLLDLMHVSSGSSLEGIRQHKLHAALVRAFPAPLPSDCEEIVLGHDRLMLVLPAGHPRAETESIPLGALVDEKFISLSRKRGTALHAQITHLWERSGLKPRIAQEAENGPAVMALVAGGLGYSILPTSFRVIRFQNVVWKAIEVDDSWTRTSLNLLYLKDTLRERIPATLIECLRSHSVSHNVIRHFG
jgi:DNA-binding transcriptional LysR family regulator